MKTREGEGVPEDGGPGGGWSHRALWCCDVSFTSLRASVTHLGHSHAVGPVPAQMWRSQSRWVLEGFVGAPDRPYCLPLPVLPVILRQSLLQNATAMSGQLVYADSILGLVQVQ